MRRRYILLVAAEAILYISLAAMMGILVAYSRHSWHMFWDVSLPMATAFFLGSTIGGDLRDLRHKL